MSGKVNLMAFSFPDQQTIIDYYAAHPIKTLIIDHSVTQKNFPGSIEKVSQFFAKKTISKDELDEKLENLFTSREVLEIKNAALCVAEKSGTEETPFKKEMESISSYKPVELVFIIKVHSKVLTDLVENAFYTPPSSEGNSFNRHVKPM